ncbi:MAG: DUF488 domain-containing protein [Bacteroidaceae bacterium]|nr:DUF488 domain-containing protein [Bacteroidaceae bacterium]
MLYTIGHSTHTQERFLELLREHGIDCLVDVRSVPMSRYAPQFDLREFSAFLHAHSVQYLFFGEEFGARQTDCLNEDGQVDFGRVTQGNRFKVGVQRLDDLMQADCNVVLMCSEADPLKCHRFALLARYFHELGLDVKHILSGGNIALHHELEQEMIHRYLHSRKYHLGDVDLLYSQEEQRKDAYRLKNKEIGYRMK